MRISLSTGKTYISKYRRKIHVALTGRPDMRDYFEKSGIREVPKLKHTPFIVYLQVNDSTIKVITVDNIPDLLLFPPHTPVMGQWTGKTRSDFFKFTVYDLYFHIYKFPRKGNQYI